MSNNFKFGDFEMNMNKSPIKNMRSLIGLFILGFFKYSNFFVNDFLTIFGNANNIDILAKIILPVGISFYTFQAISYVMDIRRGLIKPTNFLYITFLFFCGINSISEITASGSGSVCVKTN